MTVCTTPATPSTSRRSRSRPSLFPAQASWLRTDEAIDFVRAIKPQRTFPIHDAQINERALASLNSWFLQETDSGYRYLAPGERA